MLRPFLLLSALITSVALAGGVLQSDYNENATINVTPNLKASNSTLGIPLVGPNNAPVTRVSVTIADLNDGGGDGTLDEHYITNCRLWAYRYMAELRHADGGNGWSRWPEMDKSCSRAVNFANDPLYAYNDAGTGLDTLIRPSSAVTFSMPVPAGNATRRLYFESQASTDGGADTVPLANHRVIMEGVY